MCAKHKLFRASKIRNLPFFLLLACVASLGPANGACVALCARRRPSPPLPPSDCFHAPRPCASISDSADLPQTSFAVNYLNFDLHDNAMKKTANTARGSSFARPSPGALFRTMLFATMTATAPAPNTSVPLSLFDYGNFFLAGGGPDDANATAPAPTKQQRAANTKAARKEAARQRGVASAAAEAAARAAAEKAALEAAMHAACEAVEAAAAARAAIAPPPEQLMLSKPPK